MASVFTNCILKIAGRGNPPVGPPPPDCCGGFGGGNDDDDDGGDVTYPGECPYKACLQAGAGCITIPVTRDDIITQCPGLINPADYNNPDVCPYLATNVGDCATGGNPSTDAGANCVAALVGLQGQQLFSDANACESCCGNLDCDGWECNSANQSCGTHTCDLEPIPYDIPKCGAVQTNCHRNCNEFWEENAPQEPGGLWRSNALCKNQGGPAGGRCCNDPDRPTTGPPDQVLCPLYVCQIQGFPCFLSYFNLQQLAAIGWGDPENCPSNTGGGVEIAPGVWTGKANCDAKCTDPDPQQPPTTPGVIQCRLYKCVGNNNCDPVYKTPAEWSIEFNSPAPLRNCAEVNAVANQYNYYTQKNACENNCPCDAFKCEDGTGNCVPTQFQPNNTDCPPPGVFVTQGGTIYYGSPNCNNQCEEICTGWQCNQSTDTCNEITFPLSDLQATVSDCDSIPGKFLLGNKITFKTKDLCDIFCEGTDPGIVPGDANDLCDLFWCPGTGGNCLKQAGISLSNFPGKNSCAEINGSVYGARTYYFSKQACKDNEQGCGNITPITPPPTPVGGGPTVADEYCTFYKCVLGNCQPLGIPLYYLTQNNSMYECPGSNSSIKINYEGDLVYANPSLCASKCFVAPDGGFTGVDPGGDDPVCAGYYCATPGLLNCQPIARYLSQFPGYNSCNAIPNGTISSDGIEFYRQESKCKQECAGASFSDPGTFTGAGGQGIVPEYCDLHRCVGSVCISTTKSTTDLGITYCSDINILGGTIVYQGALYYQARDCNGDCITPSTDVDFGDDPPEICTAYACVNGVDCEQFNRLITSINGGAYDTCAELPPSFQSNGAIFYRTKQKCNNSTACGGGLGVDPFNQDAGAVGGGVSQPTCTLYRCDAGDCNPVSVTLGDLNDQGANLTSCLSPNSRKTIEYGGEKLYWSQSRCFIKCFFTDGGSIGDYDIFDDTPDVIDVGGGQVIDDTQGPIYCDVYSCATENQPCIQTQLRLSRINQATGSNYFACPPQTSNRIFTYDGSPYTFNQSRCDLICTTFYDSDPGRKIPEQAGGITGTDPGNPDLESCEVWRCIGNGLPCFKQYLYLNSIPFESCPTTGSFNYTYPGTAEEITYFAKQSRCNNECDNRTLINLGGNGTYSEDKGNASVIDAGGDNTSVNVDATGFDFLGSSSEATQYLTLNSNGGITRREYAFDDRESVFDTAASNRRYKDPDHYKFLPTDRGNLPSDLFANTVHLYIKSVDDMNNGRMSFSDLPYGSLSLINIERSLNSNIKRLLERAKYPDGTDIKKEILIYIRELIVTNRLDKISSDFVIRLLNECQRDDVTPENRRSTGHEAEAISLAVDTGKSVDPNKYPEGDQREQMRNWKLVATDVNKRIEVITRSGDIQDVYVNKDDSIILYDRDLSAYTNYITDGDEYETDAAVIEIVSDKDKALINDYDDVAKIMYRLNEPYEIKMVIDSAELRLVEETYDTENPREDVYVLKLDPTTLEDLPRRNPLVRHSQATFNLLEDDQEINDWVSTKPFPYMQFYVDHEDPIFEHLEAKKEAVLEFEDFSLDVFQGYEDLPIFPRRIPWHIGIVPTDRDDLMFGRSRSYQTKYNEREIIFKLNPMPSEHKTSLNNPILTRETGYGGGPRPRELTNEQSRYAFNRSVVKENIKPYKTVDEPLPRRELAGKKLFKILNELQADGTKYVNRQNDTVSWATIYQSLTPFERKALLLTEFKNWEDVKSKLFLGSFATNPEVASRYPKVSEVPKLNLDDIREYVLPTITAKKLDIEPEAETPEPLP